MIAASGFMDGNDENESCRMNEGIFRIVFPSFISVFPRGRDGLVCGEMSFLDIFSDMDIDYFHDLI